MNGMNDAGENTTQGRARMGYIGWSPFSIIETSNADTARIKPMRTSRWNCAVERTLAEYRELWQRLADV